MSKEENELIVRRVVEEGCNQGNVVRVDELNAPNFIHHDPDSQNVRNLDDYKKWFAENLYAFPDLYLSVEDLIAVGDKVVARWRELPDSCASN